MKYSIQHESNRMYNYIRCIIPLSRGCRYSVMVEVPRNWNFDDIDTGVHELVNAIRGYETDEEKWEIEYLYYEEIEDSVFFSAAR